MRALVVYCHPNPDSFTAAVRNVVTGELSAAGAELRVIDLYDAVFDPVLCQEQLERYEDPERNRQSLDQDISAIEWCDTLIFVYPTWWYGLPAVLKGWLDRVLVPGLAFEMPDHGGVIKPGLTHIHRLGVFTTCGASWWLTQMVGSPGKRTILRGVRILCARGCRTAFAAHYLMDSSTAESRSRHLSKVARQVRKLTRS
jgi:putative NADPH-quinone reductase